LPLVTPVAIAAITIGWRQQTSTTCSHR